MKIVYLDGRLYKVLREYEGDKDLSHHGSPWYETFIAAEDIETGQVKVFGNQQYEWCDALKRMQYLEEVVAKIKAVTDHVIL